MNQTGKLETKWYGIMMKCRAGINEHIVQMGTWTTLQ